MECTDADYEVFNIGGESAFTVSELANLVDGKIDMDLKFSKLIEFRMGDIRHAISSSKKILKLGWHYNSSENFALNEYIKWFKDQKIDFEKFIKIQNEIRDRGMVLKCKKNDY